MHGPVRLMLPLIDAHFNYVTKSIPCHTALINHTGIYICETALKRLLQLGEDHRYERRIQP
jgi:hypothetical protein